MPFKAEIADLFGCVLFPVSFLSNTEDLLTAKARPPPEEEFMDIFQKLKYCFSLLVSKGNIAMTTPHFFQALVMSTKQLRYCVPAHHLSSQARLKSSISNPSSEELLHHVFKPLDMVSQQ